jgi:Uma2 family endonuclease
MAPAPNRFHQDIVWNLSQLFGRYLETHPVGRVYLAPFDVFLSLNDAVQPDVVFLLNEHADRLKEDGLHGAPDLVVEVVSPATAVLDKKTKRSAYARAGVREMWLVDPLLLQVQVYDFRRDKAKPAAVLEEDEYLASPLLPDGEFAVAAILKRT